jgi:hypothetical protein
MLDSKIKVPTVFIKNKMQKLNKVKSIEEIV